MNLPNQIEDALALGFCAIQVNGEWYSCTKLGLEMIQSGRLYPGAKIGLVIKPKKKLIEGTITVKETLS